MKFTVARVLAALTICSAVLLLSPAINHGIAGSGSSAPELSPEAARALDIKIRSLVNPDAAQAQSSQPVVISELEANSYLKYRGQDFLPQGVDNPQIHIAGPDSVSGEALVDFNEVNRGPAKTNDWAAQALAWVLSGKQHVAATGKLTTGNGKAKLTIDSVTVGNTAIPQLVLDFLLQNYVQARYKIDLTKPFELPDHVNRIELGAGRATLIRNSSEK